MTNVQLQPNLYTNIFPVVVPKEPVTLMVIERAKLVDLRALRNEIEVQKVQVFIYAHEKRVYGYGQDAFAFLASKGFREAKMFLLDIPELAAHVILDGLIRLALSNGYWQRAKMSSKRFYARTEIFESSPKGVTSKGRVKVFAGYDLRCAYYPAVESMGLVVDVVWTYQDEHGNTLNTHQVRVINALNEALVIQEEYLRDPTSTTRLNPQISQMRMHNYLLPFAQKFRELPLPCGGQAQLDSVPFSVILIGR